MKNKATNQWFFSLMLLSAMPLGSALKSQTVINYGDCLAGTISNSSEVDVYTLQGAMPGDILIVRVVSLGSVRACAKIYQNGSPIPGDCDNQFVAYFETSPLAAPVSSISITVEDNSHFNTGDYKIFIQKSNEPVNVQSIVCNVPQSFNLECQSEISIWKFTSQANSLFSITLSSTSSIRTCLQIRNISGGIIVQDCGNQFTSQVQLQSNDVSCYYIYCSDFGGSNTGTVGLSLNSILGGCTSDNCNSTLHEICNNNLDDDGDGLVDCADPDCGTPIVQSVAANDPTNCPVPNNGNINISASLTSGAIGQIDYSINGGTSFQSGQLFQNLTPGNYAVRVRNSTSGCFANYANNPVELIGFACFEICNNGLDDDNDSLIDCDDDDCAPAELDWLNPPANVCPNSPFVLALSYADTAFKFELFKDGLTTGQILSGTGAAAMFTNISVSKTSTFYVVAIKNTDPTCVFDFSANAVAVGIGGLDMIVDTVGESGLGNNGKITVCLPGGQPPFMFEYSSGQGQLDSTQQGPANCLKYYVISDLPASFYKIQVSDANGCANTRIVEVNNPDKRRIGFPEKPLVTPNGDGRNDQLTFDGLFFYPEDGELTVFNRYGSVLYSAKPYLNDWDATYNGKPVPADTYFYTLRLSPGLTGETIYTGFVTIVY